MKYSNPKFRGICTVEVLRPNPDDPEKLQVVDTTTTTNHIHPELSKFRTNIVNNKYNLRRRQTSAGTSNYDRILVCFGINGETSPIPEVTVTEAEPEFRDFLTYYTKDIYKVANSNHIICFTSLSNVWKTNKYIKLGEELEEPQKEENARGFSNFVIATVPSNTQPLLSVYSEDILDIQYSPSSMFEEGTTITSVGLGISPYTSSFTYSDEKEEELGLVKMDRIIPVTSLKLEKELKISPTDYLRVKYKIGLLVDVFADPDVFSQVIFNGSAYRSHYNANYIKENWHKIANREWFSLNSAVDDGEPFKQYGSMSAGGVVSYLAFSTTLQNKSENYILRLIDRAEAYDIDVSGLKDEYKEKSLDYFNPNTLLEGNCILIGGIFRTTYGGKTPPSYTSNFDEMKNFSESIYFRKTTEAILPASSTWDYPNTKAVCVVNLLNKSLWDSSYFIDLWILKDSAINKTKFNKFTTKFGIDPEISFGQPSSVKDYDPSTDGELPA